MKTEIDSSDNLAGNQTLAYNNRDVEEKNHERYLTTSRRLTLDEVTVEGDTIDDINISRQANDFYDGNNAVT